jgi:hypothetical protein
MMLVWWATGLRAQDVRINAAVDSNNIRIGDHLRLTYTATFNPQQFRVQFPSLQDTFNHFEVIERLKADTVDARETITISKQTILTNFDSGSWKIPAMPFEVQPLQGQLPYTIVSDSFNIQVQSIAIDTAQPFKPIFGIRSASMPASQLIMYILAGLALLALLIWLIWYLRKRAKQKTKPSTEKAVPVLQPYEIALRDLNALEQTGVWQTGDEKVYHTSLTDIVRRYLEEQFEMDCFEKTSAEIIQQVKKVKALSTSRQALRTIFETADMVKFAKSKPSAEEHMHSMELAKEMVLESYKRYTPKIPATSIQTDRSQKTSTPS